MADRKNDPSSAGERGDDALREEQRTPREGIPGKGYDAGGGYGGAGNASLYRGESSSGGGRYGRQDEEEERDEREL